MISCLTLTSETMLLKTILMIGVTLSRSSLFLIMSLMKSGWSMIILFCSWIW